MYVDDIMKNTFIVCLCWDAYKSAMHLCMINI